MKILHVAPSIERAYGGPTQSLAGYISASHTVGDDVDVAAPCPEKHEIETLENAGARRVETFTGYGRGSTAASPALVRWVKARARSYDVIHVHGLFNFISTFAARAAISAGSPVIIRPFGTLSRYTFEHRRGALKRPWFERLERPNIARAAGIHFTTATEKQEAEWNRLGLGDRAFVVPPPFVPLSSITTAKRGNTVLFLGRLHPVKNLESLIDAWGRVTERFPDALLQIAGEGNETYTNALRQRAHSRAIRFTGFLSGAEKSKALAEARVLVLPSLHENFGMVVIEAISAGLPVVVSEHVQLRDFISANDLGIIAMDSADSIAAALIAALGDSALQNRAAESGRRLVEESYNPSTIGKQLSAMYLSALQVQRNRLGIT